MYFLTFFLVSGWLIFGIVAGLLCLGIILYSIKTAPNIKDYNKGPGSSYTDHPQSERYLEVGINDYRERKGLPELLIEHKSYRLAHEHAVEVMVGEESIPLQEQWDFLLQDYEYRNHFSYEKDLENEQLISTKDVLHLLKSDRKYRNILLMEETNRMTVVHISGQPEGYPPQNYRHVFVFVIGNRLL